MIEKLSQLVATRISEKLLRLTLTGNVE